MKSTMFYRDLLAWVNVITFLGFILMFLPFNIFENSPFFLKVLYVLFAIVVFLADIFSFSRLMRKASKG